MFRVLSASQESLPAFIGVGLVCLCCAHAIQQRKFILIERQIVQDGQVACQLRPVVNAGSHAGDAGLIRFRVMALNLLSRMVPDDAEQVALRARAEGLARQLEDEDLLWRVGLFR